MKALILAGGFGTRLKEVIHGRPKVMAPINGKPFLEFLVELLRRNGIDEVVMSVGYLGDFIKKYFGDGSDFGIKISYSSEDFPLGTGGAIKNAEKHFKDTFLVVNGDTYLDVDLDEILTFHNKKKALATVVVGERGSVLGSSLIKLERKGKITSFEEKPLKDKKGLVSAGYYLFDPSIFYYLRKKKRFSLEREIFPELVNRSKIFGYKASEEFIDLGTPENYKRAVKILGNKKNHNHFIKGSG